MSEDRGKYERLCELRGFKDEYKPPTEPVYYMGTDSVIPNENAYCLMKRLNGKEEIILCKSIPDKKSFEEEVENLSKYFNAVKVIELNDKPKDNSETRRRSMEKILAEYIKKHLKP